MNTFVTIFLVIAILTAILLIPFGIIAAINTLFPVLAINYGFWQYCSVVILWLTFGKTSVTVKKD